MFLFPTLIWLSVASTGLAASANLFAVDYPIVAYVVNSVKDAATTYHVACFAGSDGCDFIQPYTLIQGPKSVHMEITAPFHSMTQSFTLGCVLHGTTDMACSATGLDDDSLADVPITTTESMKYTGTDVPSFFREVPLITDSKSLMTHTPRAPGTTRYGAKLVQTNVPTSSKTIVEAQAAAKPTSTDPLVYDTSMVATPTHLDTSVTPAATTTKSSAELSATIRRGLLYAGFGLAFSLTVGIL